MLLAKAGNVQNLVTHFLSAHEQYYYFIVWCIVYVYWSLFYFFILTV